MKEEARKLIAEWDEANGESWSDCSGSIADIMIEFAKSQLEELLSDLRLVNRYSMEVNYSVSDYILPEELDALVQSWEAKL
jgi:hypothetical protein